MDDLRPLHTLAHAMGVATRYRDGLGRKVIVEADTLVRVCAALGAPIAGAADASDALRARRAVRTARALPPVLVAWDGMLAPSIGAKFGPIHSELRLESGENVPLGLDGGVLRAPRPLPFGYHRLTTDGRGAAPRW